MRDGLREGLHDLIDRLGRAGADNTFHLTHGTTKAIIDLDKAGPVTVARDGSSVRRGEHDGHVIRPVDDQFSPVIESAGGLTIEYKPEDRHPKQQVLSAGNELPLVTSSQYDLLPNDEYITKLTTEDRSFHAKFPAATFIMHATRGLGEYHDDQRTTNATTQPFHADDPTTQSLTANDMYENYFGHRAT